MKYLKKIITVITETVVDCLSPYVKFISVELHIPNQIEISIQEIPRISMQACLSNILKDLHIL